MRREKVQNRGRRKRTGDIRKGATQIEPDESRPRAFGEVWRGGQNPTEVLAPGNPAQAHSEGPEANEQGANTGQINIPPDEPSCERVAAFVDNDNHEVEKNQRHEKRETCRAVAGDHEGANGAGDKNARHTAHHAPVQESGHAACSRGIAKAYTDSPLDFSGRAEARD